MDISGMMKQAQELQRKMQEIKEQAGAMTVTSSVGGGMVSATMNGRQELISITIDPELIKPEEAEMLQDLVIAAVNDAIRRSQELLQDQMRQLTGGLNIPGLF
ncbi:MAG: YbaB/EbfC family nucleoid-associated protein [Desulfobacterales bacterium]|nr:YbaB/EbfC family nucleoid-associated protein [Desulfobacterales bacterium]